MRRILCAFLVPILLLLTASCASRPIETLPDADDVRAMPLPTPTPTAEPTPTPGPDDGRLRLGLIVPKETRGSAAEAARMAEVCAEQHADEVVLSRTDCATGEEMAAALRAAVTKEDDAVLLYPGFDGVEEAAQQAIDAGVAVIVLDLPLACEGAYRITGDDAALGTASADYLASRLGADSDVAVLLPKTENAQAKSRTDAFCRELKAAAPGIRIVECEAGSAREDCRIAFAPLLYGEADIEAVFAPDDEMTLGVLAALDEARWDGVGLVMSCGGKQEYLKAVRDARSRTLLSAVYAPFLGSKAVDFALEIYRGDAVEPVRVLRGEIVQRLNCSAYVDEESRY